MDVTLFWLTVKNTHEMHFRILHIFHFTFTYTKNKFLFIVASTNMYFVSFYYIYIFSCGRSENWSPSRRWKQSAASCQRQEDPTWAPAQPHLHSLQQELQGAHRTSPALSGILHFFIHEITMTALCMFIWKCVFLLPQTIFCFLFEDVKDYTTKTRKILEKLWRGLPRGGRFKILMTRTPTFWHIIICMCILKDAV